MLCQDWLSHGPFLMPPRALVSLTEFSDTANTGHIWEGVMAKTKGRQPKRKKEAKLTLPRRPGHRRENRATMACFQYQMDEIKAEAKRKNCSVSYLIQMSRWKDWLR